MRSLAAPSTTPTITPASSSRRVCCTPRASVSVSSTAATAPTKAAPVSPRRITHCVLVTEPPNSISASATASDAPEALPSRYGSASGLRNRPCATAPASPSSAPASHAPRVRGRRMSHTICSATGSCRADSRLWKPVLPMPRPKSSSAAPSTSRPAPSSSTRRRCAECMPLTAPCPTGTAPSGARPRPCAGRGARPRRSARRRSGTRGLRAPRGCRPSRVAAPAPSRCAR
ncbi:hypothetical protein D3C86_638930 [compost metagenome]